MIQSNVLEIKNDVFYFKPTQGDLPPLMFAYLHLAENVDESFIAVFENLETEIPSVYWWNEDDANVRAKSKHLFIELIGEAYMSLYIANKLAAPIDKPLWEVAKLDAAIIPPRWRDIVEGICRENCGNQEKK